MGNKDVNVVAIVMGCVFIGLVTSYPDKVPSSPDVCSKMTPGHGPRPQLTPAPYEIILNKQKMHGGHNLQIELQGKNGEKFRGFYIQVRDEHGSPIGTFLIPNEKEAGTHNCFDQKNNAAHHKNRVDKEKITVYWKAPESLDGKVRVVATVLKDFETYWVNVKAPELVTVSNTTDYFLSSSDFLEKRKEKSAKNSKANGILNYNPYSPFSPLLSLDSTDDNNLPSRDYLLSQASEDSTVKAQERQLFGFPSFDFHNTPFSPKLSSPRKPKVYASRPEYSQLPSPFSEQEEKLPLYRPGKNPLPYHHPHHNSISDAPKGTVYFNKNEDTKRKSSGYFNPPKMSLPFSYPPEESPYHFDIPPTFHETNSAHFHPAATLYDKPLSYPADMSQSVQSDKGGHYFINHHYLQNPSFKPVYPKPPNDPSYPNSGYFPKDILTRLTSYLPNIYNAITNNPLLNLNVDNTVESIWKPMKGVPTKQESPITSATTAHMQMPKYGYLVYNPGRKNPYFMIPAENEEEFVANHFGRRRKDTLFA